MNLFSQQNRVYIIENIEMKLLSSYVCGFTVMYYINRVGKDTLKKYNVRVTHYFIKKI